MITYVIGDIHGCYKELRSLLDKISFSPSRDHLIACGDVIAKGYDEVGVVNLLMEYNAELIIGNHDLSYFYSQFSHVLTNPNHHNFSHNDFMNWVRRGHFLKQVGSDIHLVHAGIHPLWDQTQAYQLAERAKQAWLDDMTSSHYPATRHMSFEEVVAKDSHYVIANYFTYIRKCTCDGKLLGWNDNTLEPVRYDDDIYKPWFMHRINFVENDNTKIIFGHWARLGMTKGIKHGKAFFCIDTGCVYNNMLTAISIPDLEFFQIKKII